MKARALGLYLLDRAGQPYAVDDVIEWADGYSQLRVTGAWIVARDEIGPVLVSTVFLGVADAHGRIFETATFEPFELRGRYLTRDEALAGHASACRSVRAWADALERVATRPS